MYTARKALKERNKRKKFPVAPSEQGTATESSSKETEADPELKQLEVLMQFKFLH